MLLNVHHILLSKLEIVLCALIKITRLSDQLSRHLICYVLLPAIESGKGCKRCQPLPLYELHQVKFPIDGDVGLGEHLPVLIFPPHLEQSGAVALPGDERSVLKVPVHVLCQVLIALDSSWRSRGLIWRLRFTFLCSFLLSFSLLRVLLAFCESEDL